MQLGIIGLGKMGGNMARRILRGGLGVSVFDRNAPKIKTLAEAGAKGAASLEELVKGLAAPRAVWIMLPAGKPVDDTVAKLKGLLEKGDIIVDGGNSHYTDDVRRARDLAGTGIYYVDAGVSGGIWGLEEGYCMMLGGPREAFDMLSPYLKALAPAAGYLHCGPSGAGHFVKMVHNGIEYGMMSAYAEGFSLLEASEYSKDFDFAGIAKLWNTGSVVRSWLLELAQRAFEEDGRLAGVEGYVEDSGEGRWTLQYAVESGTPTPVIAASLFSRFTSRGKSDFAFRLEAALRKQFGGHAIKTAAGNGGKAAK
ncbi:MAG: decarboxylating 6-phosphogluconate dehydrogenase [Actinomycetota bacterium]|nr:decarboxylating 6-phosphogluconate dehydrogenase [Actinomycetota bacterium]